MMIASELNSALDLIISFKKIFVLYFVFSEWFSIVRCHPNEHILDKLDNKWILTKGLI